MSLRSRPGPRYLKCGPCQQQWQLLRAWQKSRISGPTSDLLSQSLHCNRMICGHITVCADFEEKRAVLLGTRMAKPRWLKRWLKRNWLFCQGLFWSNILLIGSQSRLGIWLTIYKYAFPDHTQRFRFHWSEDGPTNLHFSKHLYDSPGAG